MKNYCLFHIEIANAMANIRFYIARDIFQFDEKEIG